MPFLKNINNFVSRNFRDKLQRNKTVNLIILVLIFFIFTFVYFNSTTIFKKYNLAVGEKAPADIRAPKNVEDKEINQKLIEKAIQSVEPIENIDPTIQIDAKKRIEKFFKKLYEVRKIYEDANNNKGNDEIILTLEEYNSFNLNRNELFFLITTDENMIQNIESYSYEVIIQVMSTGIKKEELEEEKQKIEKYFMGLEGFSDKMKNIAVKIVNNSIRENCFLDKELTQKKINEAINSVEKVYIKSGQLIISKGEEITERHYRLLKDAGLIGDDKKKQIIQYVGATFIIILIVAIIFCYIYLFNRELLNKVSNLYLITIIFLMILLISMPISSISSYLVPVSAASMLIGILIKPTLAIVLNIFITTLITLSTGNDIMVFITLLIGGTLAAISVSNAHQRSSIFLSGIIVSAVNFIIIAGFGLIYGTEMKEILLNGFYGVLNGLLCSILTIGSLPLWEYMFNILTPIKLLELSNPNHPLLKRLLVEAPGTYHHSIIVGNLSETAAQAIGCNGLLARVGAYYHDIGKLTRPYFFKENQLTSDNPHEKLTPKLSANIIKNHVKDGVELGKKHNLPMEITEIIEQHHGTTLVKYFYHKAINDENNSSKTNINDYKYKGPNPKSKESAIVMLADSVEAAVRCMSEPTKENLKDLVEKIIDDKLNNNQLIDCDLTFKDIEIITNAFVSTLTGIFHERIEYPEINEKELEVNS